MKYFEAIKQYWTKRVRALLLVVRELWRANKVLTLLLIVSSVFIGLLPALQVSLLEGLVDGLLGAKSIRVLTSDVASLIVWQCVYLGLLSVSLWFMGGFSGASKRLSRSVSWFMFWVGMLVLWIQFSPIVGPLLIVVLFVSPSIETKAIKISLAVLTFLITVPLFTQLIDSTVFNRSSLGEGVAWIVCLLATSAAAQYLFLKD